MTLPTILLIPGAFTTPACYDFLAPHLEKAGYPVVRASLITTNPKTPDECTATLEGQHLLNTYLLPFLESGKEVLVFAHSFGATTLSAPPPNRTFPGQILGIVYISCAFARSGVSQLEYLGGQWPPFCKLSNGLVTFDPTSETLYNEIEDPELQRKLGEGHLPQAIKAFETPVKDPLWADGRLDGKRVYLLTKKDGTFPAEAQKMFVDNCGVGWKIVEIDGGHCAFISRPEEVAEIVIDAAKRWA